MYSFEELGFLREYGSKGDTACLVGVECFLHSQNFVVLVFPHFIQVLPSLTRELSADFWYWLPLDSIDLVTKLPISASS